MKKGLCIYLDGMCEGIHGNSDAQAKAKIIREELWNEGYEIISIITTIELDDKKAMVGYFKRIAKFLLGRELA